MKAFQNSTVHYRNSICTITAVQTTLTYITFATYSRSTAKCGGMNSDRHTLCRTMYSQYNQPKLIYWQHLKLTPNSAQTWCHSGGSLPAGDGSHSTDQPNRTEVAHAGLSVGFSKVIPESRLARLSILILSKTYPLHDILSHVTRFMKA
jgi:hypothetical protein